MKITTNTTATLPNGTTMPFPPQLLSLLRDLDGRKVAQVKVIRLVHEASTGNPIGLKAAKDFADGWENQRYTVFG